MSKKTQNRYSIEEKFNSVQQNHEAKERLVDFMFCFLLSERGEIIINEEIEWFYEVYQFFDEREKMLLQALKD